jgi:hypothetical protein
MGRQQILDGMRVIRHRQLLDHSRRALQRVRVAK